MDVFSSRIKSFFSRNNISGKDKIFFTLFTNSAADIYHQDNSFVFQILALLPGGALYSHVLHFQQEICQIFGELMGLYFWVFIFKPFSDGKQLLFLPLSGLWASRHITNWLFFSRQNQLKEVSLGNYCLLPHTVVSAFVEITNCLQCKIFQYKYLWR